MLPKNSRLIKRIDFEKVYKRGRFFSANGITVQYLRTGNVKTKIGFSVGKKFSKMAIERNSMRRLLRESIRSLLSMIEPGFDIVISCKSVKNQPSLKIITERLGKMLESNSLLIKQKIK